MPDLIGPLALPGALPGDANRVAIAYSGGLDSTVLLHLLAASPAFRRDGLRAIHIHHGLHALADEWAVHCQDICDALDMPLHIERVSVERTSGFGPEAAARNARHAAFETLLGDGEYLATAHHRDDQAETFLLRALRASGPDGLAAMAMLRRLGRGWLWRPLLRVPRAQLLAYAEAHSLRWIEDPSNADTELDRNFLRHRVIPLLRERWPQFDAAFARSAALSGEAGTLLSTEDAAALASARDIDPHMISVAAIAAMPAARRARALRRWIDELGLPALPAAGVAHVERDLIDAAVDSEAVFAWSDAVVRRWRGVLHADWRQEPLPRDWTAQWDGRTPLMLPGGGGWTLQGADAFDAELRAHSRVGGERIALPGRGHTHSLKHVLQDLGVPPWERARLPLLSDGEALLAAGDVAYSAPFETWLRTHDARLVWTRRVPSSPVSNKQADMP